MYLLAGDLGGTKTLLCLVEYKNQQQWQVLYQQKFTSNQYAQFDDLIDDFIKNPAVHDKNIHAACLVVAGPVFSKKQQQTAKITYLPWVLNNQQLAKKFNLNQVKLLNDFQGIGHGIPALRTKDLVCLQQGQVQPHSPCAVIGAGTGLGEAMVMPTRVLPSEGGHMGFAPETPQQTDLLRYLQTKYPRVSYQELLSGQGLVNIYQFLRATQAGKPQATVEAEMQQHDPATVISQHALAGDDDLAVKTFELFAQIYASQAANLALTCLAYGGVYVAGGIAAKNLKFFQQPAFLEAFLAKQPMRHLLEQMPLYVIKNQEVGLLGAILVAGQA